MFPDVSDLTMVAGKKKKSVKNYKFYTKFSPSKSCLY